MNKYPILILFFTLFSNYTWACTCYTTMDFNLFEYDIANNIAVIKIIEKIPNTPTNNPQPNEMPSIPTLTPNYSTFKIEIIEVLKRQKETFPDTLRVMGKQTSCYWEPTVGATYIFYLNKIQTNASSSFLQKQPCQRFISQTNPHYTQELTTLRLFQQHRNGRFTTYQHESHSPLIKGKFKNGQRHGKWQLYYHLQENIPQKIELYYKKGILIGLNTDFPKSSSLPYMLSLWVYYYEELVNINNK